MTCCASAVATLWQRERPDGAEATYLQWNQKHEQILSTSHNNGRTVVWDMRKNRDVVTLGNAAGCAANLRCTAMLSRTRRVARTVVWEMRQN